MGTLQELLNFKARDTYMNYVPLGFKGVDTGGRLVFKVSTMLSRMAEIYVTPCIKGLYVSILRWINSMCAKISQESM
jgi:hypothetical protein